MRKYLALVLIGTIFAVHVPVMAESGCSFYDQYGYHDWEDGDYVNPTCTDC